MKLGIAHSCIDLMDALGIIKNGMSFQSGAGGISLAVTKYLGEVLEEKNLIAAFAIGGITKYITDIYESGRIKKLYFGQCFDTECVSYISEKPGVPILNVEHYADPLSKGRSVDNLDVVVLGATEVDTSMVLVGIRILQQVQDLLLLQYHCIGRKIQLLGRKLQQLPHLEML